MNTDVDKQELLRRLHSGFARLHQMIAHLTPQQLDTAGVIGTWSIKDTIAHFIAHEQFALNELSAARRGESYRNPFRDSDAMNAAAVAQYVDEPVDRVLRAWEASFRQVVATVDSLTEADFSPDGSVVHCLGDTIDGALANNTYEHYAEHLPAIEAWMRQQA
jgi:hypothetical protein